MLLEKLTALLRSINNIHFLLTALHRVLQALVGRTCLDIKTFYLTITFSFLLNVCLISYWNCKEKLNTAFYYGSNCQNGS